MVVSSRWVRALLLSGVVAPPLLLLVIGVDGAMRSGYDVWRHGVSQLTMGELGWLERLTYLVCGLLVAGFALGMAQVLASGPAATWAPRLVGAVGVGLVMAGVFPTDPALGYPVGAAAAVSVNGRLHQLGGTVLFAGLIGACFVCARRFGRGGRRSWAVYSRLTGAVVAVSALAAGIVYRLEIGGVLSDGPAGGLERVAFLFGFGWIALVAIRLVSDEGVRDGTPQTAA